MITAGSMAGRLMGSILTAVGEPSATGSTPGPLLAGGGQLSGLFNNTQPFLGTLLSPKDGGMGHVDVSFDREEAGESLVTQLTRILVILLILQTKYK